MKERIIMVMDEEEYNELSQVAESALQNNKILKSLLENSQRMPKDSAGVTLNSEEYDGKTFIVEKLMGVGVMKDKGNMFVQGSISNNEFLDLLLGMVANLLNIYIDHFELDKKEAAPWFKELFTVLVESVTSEEFYNN